MIVVKVTPNGAFVLLVFDVQSLLIVLSPQYSKTACPVSLALALSVILITITFTIML